MRAWRNWQTRMIQVHVSKDVEVRLLSPALKNPRRLMSFRGFWFLRKRNMPKFVAGMRNIYRSMYSDLVPFDHDAIGRRAEFEPAVGGLSTARVERVDDL